jgi:hypothetical protein
MVPGGELGPQGTFYVSVWGVGERVTCDMVKEVKKPSFQLL